MSRALFYSCLAGVFFVLFNFSITTMAGIYIVSDLGGSLHTSYYTLCFFGIGNVGSIPLALYLRDRFGFRQAFLMCITLFAISSFLLAFSPTYAFFLFLRFLEGAASGPIFILSAALVSMLADEKKLDSFMRWILVIFIVAPTLAAAYGGIIAYEAHWTHIFHLDGLMLLGLYGLFVYAFRDFSDEIKPARFDLFGYLLFLIVILSWSIFAILGQELDWFRSSLLFALFLLGCFSFPAFLVWVYYHEYPALQVRIFKNFGFVFALFFIVSFFSTYFGMLELITLWLSEYVNYNGNWVALTMLAIFISSFFLMVSIYSTKRRRRLKMLGLGLLFLICSSIYTMQFNAEVNFGRIALSRMITGFGIALFLPPIFNLAVRSLEESKRIHGLIWFQCMRALSSSFGAALYATLWQRRTYFYYDRLGSQLTTPIDPIEASKLNSALLLQSSSLALNDSFYLMVWIFVSLFILLALAYIFKKPAFQKIPI